MRQSRDPQADQAKEKEKQMPAMNSRVEQLSTVRALSAVSQLLAFLTEFDPELTPSMVNGLLYIHSHEGCSVSDMARGCGMTLSTATRTAQYYTRWYKLGVTGKVPGKEFIEIVEDDRDRRVKRCVMTPKGKAFVAKIAAFITEC